MFALEVWEEMDSLTTNKFVMFRARVLTYQGISASNKSHTCMFDIGGVL